MSVVSTCVCFFAHACRGLFCTLVRLHGTSASFCEFVCNFVPALDRTFCFSYRGQAETQCLGINQSFPAMVQLKLSL